MKKIHVEDWHHTCGDGCCDEWGTAVYVDGKAVELSYGVDVDDIESILKAVGVDYEITYEDTRYDNRIY